MKPLKLSRFFTLAELEHTSVRTVANQAPPDAVLNLRDLCVEHLDKIRERWGPLYVSSGYRCEELNRIIGGSPTSMHRFGCAADLVPLGPGVTVRAIAKWLRDESGLAYDQVIDEKAAGPGWLHYGIAPPGKKRRRQTLIMRGGKYAPFPEDD